MARSKKTQPKGEDQSKSKSPRRGRWLLLGSAIGAVVHHFTDPQIGRTRRAKAKDMAAARVRRPARQAVDVLQAKTTMARDRAAGRAHELTTSKKARMPTDDRALVDKVRSEALGGDDWKPYTINVNALDGVVTLRGEVDTSDKIDEAVKAVKSVPGVQKVESYLHLPGEEAPNVAAAHDATSGA